MTETDAAGWRCFEPEVAAQMVVAPSDDLTCAIQACLRRGELKLMVDPSGILWLKPADKEMDDG